MIPTKAINLLIEMWPMLLLFVIVLITIRLTYIKVNKKKFVLYKGRLKSIEQKTKDTNFLSMCLDYLEQDVYRYGRTGYELLKEKFPYSRVVVDEARCKTEEQLIKYVREKMSF